MPLPREPLNPSNILDTVQQFTSPGPNEFSGERGSTAPSPSGFGTRQSRVPNNRPAVSTRHIMHWFIPEQPIVQMYINPQRISYNYKKSNVPTRTKGGFVIQYWGEELTTLNIEGTTGSSGIEGINVLKDVYRSEQLSLDPYALFIAAQVDSSTINGGAVGESIGDFFGGSNTANAAGGILGGLLAAGADSINPNNIRPKPSLAQLAYSVELYWSGSVYRGYFDSFSVTESVTTLGMFDYTIAFTVTQERGFRQNFMPWHRSATDGPSNSNPEMGRKYSFGTLATESATASNGTASADDISQSIQDALGFDF